MTCENVLAGYVVEPEGAREDTDHVIKRTLSNKYLTGIGQQFLHFEARLTTDNSIHTSISIGSPGGLPPEPDQGVRKEIFDRSFDDMSPPTKKIKDFIKIVDKPFSFTIHEHQKPENPILSTES